MVTVERLSRSILMKDARQEDGWLIWLRDYALMAVTILAGIVLLPILISLYLVPSVREAFDQLAYEDAMRG